MHVMFNLIKAALCVRSITRNERKVDCPIIYKDTIHNTISFIEISTMPGTRKLIRQLQRRGVFLQKFLIDFIAYVHIF